MAQISRHIAILRKRIIVLNRIQAVAFSTTAICCYLAVCVCVDFVVHWPIAARSVIFLVTIAIAHKIFKRWVKPAWNQTPTITSVAIRIEDVEPSLRGYLASAVDFELGGVDKTNHLVAKVVERANNLWKLIQPNKHIQWLPAIYATSTTIIITGLWLTSFYFSEQATKTGLTRTIIPWSQTDWPPELLIHPELSISHVAKGETVLLRARADENQDPKKINRARVSVICEIKEKNQVVSKKIFEMTAQTDGSWEKPVVAEGELMTVVFFTEDTKTPPIQIEVIEPPTVESAKLVIHPPSYAVSKREVVEMNWNGGTVPTLPTVLVGATASLQLNLSAPPKPPQDTNGKIDPAWLARTISVTDTTNNTSLNAFRFVVESQTQWRLFWTIQGGTDIVVDPCDENGIHGQQPLRIRIQVVVDQEPTVVVGDPEEDEIVTNKATLPILIQARDDLGLVSIGMRVDRQQRSGEPVPKLIQIKEVQVDSGESELKNVLEISTTESKSGDTLLLRGMAQDRFETEGIKRRVTLSEPRRIRIVDQDVFEQNIRQQTNTLRQNVARLEINQKETIEQTEITNSIQSQKNLSDRIDQTQKTANKLAKRLRRNGMKDSNITEALQGVEQQASVAATHSQSASQQLQQGATGNEKAVQEAKKEQAQSLQAIHAMLDILDRDNDAAGAQHRTDKLAQEISRLRKELQKTASKTTGRPAEDLSAQEKEQLQEQAQKQRVAAQEARALVEDLFDRAQQNNKKDPIQAQSLRAAAEEGERGDAAKRLEESADRSEKNQTGAADNSMQAAADAVEKIQKALKVDRKAKTEELKRRLSSLVETIKGLVAHAETGRNEIDTLQEAAADIKTVIEKNAERLARNTAATIEESKTGGRAMEQVTKILVRASDLESGVVIALRSNPIQIDTARETSSRGLELLKQALEKAEQEKARQQEEESEKEREELANKYREYAQLQKVLRQEVAAIITLDQKDLNRQDAVTSREIAGRQKTLRQQVKNILNKSTEINDAAVFVKTHELIDQWMGSAQEQLAQVKPTPETVNELDFVTEALDGLAIALTDPEQKEDPFAQENSGGGEGGSGGSREKKKTIPPLAEIRLVRELQAQINRRTKLIEEVGINSPGAAKAVGDLSKLQDTVRTLGEEWVEKMKKASNKEATPTTEPKNEAHKLQSRSLNAPPKNELYPKHLIINKIVQEISSFNNSKQNEQAKPTPQTPKQNPIEKPPQTLDELLGIGGKGGEMAAQEQRKDKLERGLNEESLKDLAEAAMQDMKLAQQLVSRDHDLGIGTQRVQAQVLSRLDALIDAAVKFEKSSQKKSSKSKPQQKKSDSQSGSQKSKNDETNKEGNDPQKDGDKKNQKNKIGNTDKSDSPKNNGEGGDKVNTPEFEDAQLQADADMEEGRSEWGHLPLRIREIMSQSRRDRISALYQRATEAYYRRMAEERGP